jgi:hypothetical protein
MVSTNNDNPTGMPVQLRSNFVAGTNSPFTSAAKAGALDAEAQNKLIKTGGKKRRYNGGAANLLTVPPVQAGAVNSSETTKQYVALTKVTAGAVEDSKYDGAVAKGVSKGGSRSRRKRNRSRRRSRRSRRSRRRSRR